LTLVCAFVNLGSEIQQHIRRALKSGWKPLQ